MRANTEFTNINFGVNSQLVHTNVVKLLRVDVQDGPSMTACLFCGR